MTSIIGRRVFISMFAVGVVLSLSGSARADVPEQLIHEAQETGAESPAAKPNAGLVQGSDGAFYGTSRGLQNVNGNVLRSPARPTAHCCPSAAAKPCMQAFLGVLTVSCMGLSTRRPRPPMAQSSESR